MDPRLDTDGWLTLTETHYWISTDRDLHPARCAELSSARSHGRNAGHPAPPAQTRTCGFPASGSSVELASVRTFTVTRYKIQLLFPAVRLARVIQPYMSGTSFLCGLYPSVRSFPLHAWFTHACGWLSQPLSTMPDKTPQWHIAALRRPTCVSGTH